MSQITDFFLRGGTDTEGRTFEDMLKMSDDELEKSHTVIQWLFPLNEASRHNIHAPILTDQDIVELRQQQIASAYAFGQATSRFMDFYGLKWNEDGVFPTEKFSVKSTWLAPRNHNLKRITRIIRCAVLLDLPFSAEELLRGFADLKNTEQGSWLDDETLSYWKDAVTLPINEKLNVLPMVRKIFRT